MSIIKYFVLHSKLGWIGIIAKSEKIKEIVFPGSRQYIIKRIKKNYQLSRQTPNGLKRIITSLGRYLNGKKETLLFNVDLNNYTPFEKKIYRALKKVTYGDVKTYGWLARQVGSPMAARAVGNALAKNRFPFIIPCHRIIRSNGSIGEFSAGGGINLKRKLLEMESKGKSWTKN